MQGGPWNDYNRNFTLAKKCLKKMAEMGYKVAIVSRDVSKEPELAPFLKSGNIVVHKSGEDALEGSPTCFGAAASAPTHRDE